MHAHAHADRPVTERLLLAVPLLKAVALRFVMRDPARLAMQARQRELLEEFRGAHDGDSSPRVSKFLERMKQLFGS